MVLDQQIQQQAMKSKSAFRDMIILSNPASCLNRSIMEMMIIKNKSKFNEGSHTGSVYLNGT